MSKNTNGLVGTRKIDAGMMFDGRYLLEKKIGQGGFGSVWDAVDLTTNQHVAVKTLNAKDKNAKALFRNEADIPAILAGTPGIVKILGRGTENGVPYIVMPLLKGENLYEARKTMDGDDAIDIVADVLGTLGKANAKGIIHKDIKPANIFIDSSGTKVIDWGLAQVPWGQPFNGGGTEGFRSPEQARNEIVDPRTDVYAVSATLYELLSGHTPSKQCPVRSMSKVAPWLRKDLSGVIDTGLECDADKRYADADHMLKHLAPFVRDLEPRIMEAIREREAKRANVGAQPQQNGSTQNEQAWGGAAAVATWAVIALGAVGGIWAIGRES